jgi:indolepyruvate ferredoxin oxidoreductase beta subunit
VGPAEAPRAVDGDRLAAAGLKKVFSRMNTMTDTITFPRTGELPARPITILVAALGGEGGGVLADWIVAAATDAGLPVQSTSIPGVAQRTGATTYYLELYPAKWSDLGPRRPVLALTPSPGNVDLMLASELVEAGRAMQNGFVSPDRTTLVASTHRVYTVAEKMAMGDGRTDGERIVKAANELAKRAVLFDMADLAGRSGTVINAVLFGAMAGAGVLPLSREACEAAIKRAGRGVEGSLKGFALGYAHATGEAKPPSPAELKRWRENPVARVRSAFAAETHRFLEEGVARCADFQDAAYATLYLDRLEPIARLDRDGGGGATGLRLTNETARFLALWMCYEDVIRVADLKSRRSRFERVRAEVQAKPDEPVHIIEYLKPGVEEVAAVLPRGLSAWLTRWAERRGLTHKLNVGMYVKTTSVFGFLTLRILASLRRLRRITGRYHEEQALIDRWLEAVRSAAARDRALALEVALCGRLIKGYGDTHRRGKGNFLRILDTIVSGGSFASDAERATAIRKAREAALADPEGRKLDQSLETVGVPPRPPQPKPLQFFRRPPREAALKK